MLDQADISLDILLRETLAMSEKLQEQQSALEEMSDKEEELDDDYLYDLADSTLEASYPIPFVYPETSGIIYKIDKGSSTFCVRGFTTANIQESMRKLQGTDSSKRSLLKIFSDEDLSQVSFFSTDTFELAESVKEQILNRRFPFQEDSVCNLSDPGFSWWMNLEKKEDEDYLDRFEIYFKSHGVNRVEKYIQLGPIGDGAIAALRLNQALSLLKSSFPISEYSCDDKCFIVATTKPDHLSFKSFRDIFLHGTNNTSIENFPDNMLGKTLYYYFHELAIVRKFWIEVKTKLG